MRRSAFLARFQMLRDPLYGYGKSYGTNVKLCDESPNIYISLVAKLDVQALTITVTIAM